MSRPVRPVDILQCTIIKLLVEEHSGVRDIGILSRSSGLPSLKQIYCKCCRAYTNASYGTIAVCLRSGYHHTTAMYSVKTFDNLFQTKQFYFSEVFYSVAKYLSSIDK